MRNMHILVARTDGTALAPQFAQLIRNYGYDGNFKVMGADTKEEALKLAEKTKPDIIIAGITLGGETYNEEGLALAQILAEQGYNVVLLTSNPWSARAEIRDRGALSYATVIDYASSGWPKMMYAIMSEAGYFESLAHWVAQTLWPKSKGFRKTTKPGATYVEDIDTGAAFTITHHAPEKAPKPEFGVSVEGVGEATMQTPDVTCAVRTIKALLKKRSK